MAEWSIGCGPTGSGVGTGADFSAVGPVGEPAADSAACFFGTALGLALAAFFFATGFFFTTGFAGIGMVMPGMCACCAETGAGTLAIANALAAINNPDFTIILHEGEAPTRGASPVGHGFS